MLPNYHQFNNDYYDNLLIDSVYKGELKTSLGNNLQILDGGGRHWWIKRFFTTKSGDLNYNFYNLYIKYLTKISSKNYLDSFFEERKKDIERINSKIYSDYFFYAGSRDYTWGLYYYKQNDLYHRAEVIRKRLETNYKKITAVIDKDKNLVIDVAYDYYNKTKNQIRLDNLKIDYINCSANSQVYKKTFIKKSINLGSTTKIKLNFLNLNEHQCKSVKIIDNKLDKNYFVKINYLNSFHNLDEFKLSNQDLFLNFFKKKNNDLFLKEKTVKIDTNLYIPNGMNVIIYPGQKIILTNNSFIISDSRWIVDGSAEQIFISGVKDNFGGGLMIRGPIEKSYFNNVKFTHLNGFKKEFLDKKNNVRYSTITSHTKNKINNYSERVFIKDSNRSNSEFNILGSLNFYETNVQLKNLIFDKIASEDALNVINSKFIINDIKFIENISDSIDSDFSSGTINDAKFMNIGNDAIDFSGSAANVKNLYFNDIGDKLISAGENSNIDISNIKAEKSYVGIASKDGSFVNGENIFMENVKLPFVSYNKKFEYEPASMYLKNVNLYNFYKKWVSDKNSKIYHENLEVGLISEYMIPVIYKKQLELLKNIN